MSIRTSSHTDASPVSLIAEHGEEAVSPADKAVYTALFDALFYGHGLDSLAAIASEILGGNPLCISDTSYKNIAVSLTDDMSDPIFVFYDKKGYIGGDTLAALKADGVIDRLHTDRKPFFAKPSMDLKRGIPDIPYGMIFASIRINDMVVAHIHVFGLQREFDEHALEWIDLICRVVSIELQKDEFFIRNRGIMYESLLNDILEQRLSNTDSILERMALLERTLEKDLYVVCFRGRTEKSSELILRYVGQSTLRDMFPGSMSVVYKNDIVLLVSREQGKQLVGVKQHELDSFLQGNNVIAGISNVFNDISEMRLHYLQALKAIELGEANPDEVLFYYSAYSLYHMLSVFGTQNALEELCNPALLDLCRSESASNQELLRTLFIYLRKMKDIRTVSDELHIHRNTLFYRINKIAKLTRFDFNDGDDVFEAMYSFKVLEYLGLFSSPLHTSVRHSADVREA